MNLFEKEKKVYLNLIQKVDADFFIVHARHGSEHYEAEADYSVFQECVETGKIIIANGDIDSREKVQFLKSIGVSGVMIVRAAVRNPSIFNHLKGKSLEAEQTLRKEYLKLAEKYQSAEKYRVNILKRLGSFLPISDESIVRG